VVANAQIDGMMVLIHKCLYAMLEELNASGFLAH
jgi:hypothetical protein